MWGDLRDEEAEVLPKASTTIKDGIKTVVEYRLNEKTQQKERVTKKYKIKQEIERKNKGMLERETWAKFGDCADHDEGINPKTTGIAKEEDAVYLELTSRAETLDDEAKPDLKKLQKTTITCSICKGAHFTSKCPERDALNANAEAEGARGGAR